MFKKFLYTKKTYYRIINRFYSNIVSNGENNTKNCNLIDKLKDEGKNIFSPNSENETTNIDFKEWESQIMTLKKYGFNDKSCLYIIKNNPAVLKIPKKNLENILEQWNLCNLGFNNIHSILTYQSHFLQLSGNEIRKRISYLHSLCKSKATLAILLIENPNIMTEEWKSILSKIDFLQRVKRICTSEIIHSNALSKSLDFIKLRFDILEKCGLFKVIKVMPHKSKLINHKNPHLKKITDLTDEKFAKYIAHISDEEYITCNEFYFYSKEYDDEFVDYYSDRDCKNNYVK